MDTLSMAEHVQQTKNCSQA